MIAMNMVTITTIITNIKLTTKTMTVTKFQIISVIIARLYWNQSICLNVVMGLIINRSALGLMSNAKCLWGLRATGSIVTKSIALDV